MKSIIKYGMMLAVCVAGLFTACGDDDDDADLQPQVTIAQQEVLADNKAQTKNISLKTNVNLTLVSSEAWCTIEQEGETTANGVATYKLIIERNTDTQERRALINVNYADQSLGVIAVTQSAGDFVKVNETSPLELSSDVAEFALNVQGSMDFTFKITCDWITTVGSVTDGKQIFRVKANFDVARTDTIIITCGNAQTYYVVRQAAGEIVDLGMESTARQLASKIYAGINIGNTMEVPLGANADPGTSGETGWGNPVVNEDYIRGLRNAGFNAVRIPCSWNSHIEDFETCKVSDKWMERVKEVVDMVVNNGMYAILNIHWDGGWLENNCTADKQEANNKQQHAIWTQIANTFIDYDERLLFAGCNEPNVETQEQMNVLATYEQTFVDAVRATGGRNAMRVLIVQGPSTNIDRTSSLMTLPTDVVEDRLMVEVHFYDPYTFCLMEKDESWGKVTYFWGSARSQVPSDLKSRCASDVVDSDGINTQFLKMKKKYSNQGIPVILGEYGAYYRSETVVGKEYYDLHKASVDEWLYEATRQAKTNGLVPFLWDTGNIISRHNGSVLQQSQLDNLMKGASEGVYPSIYK